VTLVRPLVTVVVPSLNQGEFLSDALESIFEQTIPCEVFVMDGGSQDESLDIIRRYEKRLAGWQSAVDGGQAAAINEGVARGTAPYVCWLNSDDWWLEGALQNLLVPLEANASLSFSYGRVWNVTDPGGAVSPVWVSEFDLHAMSQRCLISQPGTLIRRGAWEAIGGLDASLRMAMDYDLWWRLVAKCGYPAHVRKYVAVNRDHASTKTNTARRLHYDEATSVVARHYGYAPLKWTLARPYAIWYRSLRNAVASKLQKMDKKATVRRRDVRFPDDY
jgi:glycosyltransferase involved in cell wall biosynthesis